MEEVSVVSEGLSFADIFSFEGGVRMCLSVVLAVFLCSFMT